ncbi:hypothetical protein D3C80_1964640 [compost metagenome]
MPVMPQNDAGWRIEPPVSVPVTAGARRAATATALPPDEPPGMRSVSQGLRTGAEASKPTGNTAEFSLDEPIANSSQLSLPSVTAPASASLVTTVASKGDW